MDYKELLGLIDAVDKSNLTKFSFKEGNIEIGFEKKIEVVTTNLENIQLHGVEKATEEDEQFEYIKSPLIGTYYSSKSPEENKFISVGDKVSKGQIIGIIEVMKMMNEVKCDFDGVVEEILIENNETVEYGQCLVKIKLI